MFSLAYAYVMLMLVLISHAVVEKTADNADINRVRRKIESSSSEAKIVRIGKERRTIFSRRPEKGTNKVYFFALEGKIEQRIRISAIQVFQNSSLQP